MKIASSAGGPAGLYFAISMKLRDPSHDIHVFERNPPRSDLRLGRGLLRSDGRESRGQRPGVGARSSPTVRPLGRHRSSFPRRIASRSCGHGFIGIGRKRLLEILQDRAASSAQILHFEAGVRPRPTPAWRELRSGHRRRRHQQPRFRDADPDAFGVDVDVRAQQVRLARHHQGIRRLHLRFRGDRAWLDLGARLSLRARLLDLHRRMFGRDLAGLGFDSNGPDRSDRRPASGFSRNISAGTALISNAGTSPRLGGLAELPAHQLRALVARQDHPDRRRRPHRPFLDRLGNQARARGRDQARRGP